MQPPAERSVTGPKQPGGDEGPAGLYVHIPFCLSKCPYCSFNSFPAAGRDLDGYLTALTRQARRMAGHPLAGQLAFASFYIGGGTPTIYAAGRLARLVEDCMRLFPFIERPEITVETNPNTVSHDKMALLKQAGVNRLSIGIQSFSDKVLKKTGRTHSAADGLRAFDLAKKAGFTNINLDLMYGLPGQDTGDWLETLTRAVSLGPSHLSVYELMIEEGTPFAESSAAGLLDLPSEEGVLEMEEILKDMLQDAGFERYEISNFARPDRFCRHNVNYWKNGSYLGLGAGAVSCLSGIRIKNVPDPGLFSRLLAGNEPPFAEAECLALPQRFRETVIMGLRMLKGVSIQDLETRFGLNPMDYYRDILQELFKKDLVAVTSGHLHLTAKGLRVANQVSAELV